MIILIPGKYLIELEITRPIDPKLLVIILQRFGFTDIITDPSFSASGSFAGMGKWLFMATLTRKISVRNINGIRWTLIRKLEPAIGKRPFLLQTNSNYLLQLTANPDSAKSNIRYGISKLGFKVPSKLLRIASTPIKTEWIALARWPLSPKVLRETAPLQFQQIREV